MHIIIYLIAFIVSLIQTIGQLTSNSIIQSGCSINSYVDCSVVSASSFSNIYGFPVAALALTWAIVGLINYKKPERMFWFNALSLLVSLNYFFIMIFILKTLCLYCLILDLLIAIAFWQTFKYRSQKPQKVLIAQTAIVLTLLIAIQQLIPNSAPSISTPQVALTKPLSLILGNSEGSKEVIIFTDFQCPACAVAASYLKEILQEDKELKLKVYNYPLSNQCNYSMGNDLHPWSCEAARISLCLSSTEFVDYYYLVYKNQFNIKSKEDLWSLLNAAQIVNSQLKECVDSDKTTEKLVEHISLGDEMGLQGTPYIIYKDKVIQNWGNLIDFKNSFK
jgi:protein-disulfide isomerase